MTFSSFEEAFHAHQTRSPNACAALGVDRSLDQLPDPSLGAIADDVKSARALLTECDALHTAEQDFERALDLRLARQTLGASIEAWERPLNDGLELAQKPTAGDDIGSGIFLMMLADPRPEPERLADICGRVEAVPAYLEKLKSRLDRPVERWRSMDLEKVEGLPTLFGSLQGWAKEIGWSDLGRLESASARAVDALGEYRGFLGGLDTTTQIHVGPERAETIVSGRGIELPLGSLHGIARDFLKENQETIEAHRRRLTVKYGLADDTTAPELQKFLNDRYRFELVNGDLESVLTRYQQERERILAFIAERRLFPVFPDQDMLILRTPSFLTPTIPAGAMFPPAPFREGIKKSLISLTLAEDLVSEHTELSIPMMMVHEGIPGHHLQLATASTHPSIIRRHVDAMEHAEGWTTMLEDYMLDVGYVAPDLIDEVRFSTKRDLARIGARVAIDLFFMTGERDYLEVGVPVDLSGDEPFGLAGNLLQAVTGFPDGRTQGELNWYSQERGYPLSYLTGNHLVRQLKRDVEAAHPDLDPMERDRRFHRLYLESGNMPLASLRKVFAHHGLIAAA